MANHLRASQSACAKSTSHLCGKKVNKTGKGFLFFLFNVYVQVASVSLYFIVWGDTSSIFSSNPSSSSLVAFINMFFINWINNLGVICHLWFSFSWTLCVRHI